MPQRTLPVGFDRVAISAAARAPRPLDAATPLVLVALVRAVPGTSR